LGFHLTPILALGPLSAASFVERDHGLGGYEAERMLRRDLCRQFHERQALQPQRPGLSDADFDAHRRHYEKVLLIISPVCDQFAKAAGVNSHAQPH
jgi:hypothetical protein